MSEVKTKEEVKNKRNLKEQIARSASFVLPYVPKFGLDFMVRRIQKKMDQAFEENIDGLDERELRWKKEWVDMALNTFLTMTKKRLSKNVRHKIISNLMNNAFMKGKVIREEFLLKEGFAPPGLVVISPTMRCNIHCSGCYAGEYTKKDDMSLETFEKILTEMRDEMGAYFVVITGGEPWILKDQLLHIFEKFNDMYFITFTNGMLIDEEVAKGMEKVGNVTACISVEGFEEETDARRGKGVYKKVLEAMSHLKKAGVPFSYSGTVTTENWEMLSSDKFVDFYKEQGALAGWYFQIMPIGRKPDVNLMPRPEQRQEFRRRVYNMRKQKKLLAMDFWGDGTLSGGCIAGGKAYFHINPKGDIEPCVFCHFAADNIKDKTIKEALNSDFFKAYRANQDDIEDRFRPCQIIDHPEMLRDIVSKTGAKPTHDGADSVVKELAPQIDEIAAGNKAVSGKSWDDGEN